MRRLSISHPRRTTFEIGTDEDGIICMAAPIAGRFLGQRMEKLFRWLESLGPGLEVEEIE